MKIAKEQRPLDAGLEAISEPSIFACPECHGVLLRLKEEGPIRFRCHTGHAYSIDSLLGGVTEGIEEALWNSIRALEEGDMLLRAIAEHVRAHGSGDADALAARAAEIKRQSETLRRIVMERDPLVAEP